MNRDPNQSLLGVLASAILLVAATWWTLWLGSAVVAALREIASAIREASL